MVWVRVKVRVRVRVLMIYKYLFRSVLATSSGTKAGVNPLHYEKVLTNRRRHRRRGGSRWIYMQLKSYLTAHFLSGADSQIESFGTSYASTKGSKEFAGAASSGKKAS